MSRYSDLPSGCSPSDIPGNRPEDLVSEELYELFSKAWSYAFTEEQIVEIWREAVKEEEAKADDYERRREGA